MVGGRAQFQGPEPQPKNPEKCLDYAAEACHPALGQAGVGMAECPTQGAIVSCVWTADQISMGCCGLRSRWKGNLECLLFSATQAGGLTQAVAPKPLKLTVLHVWLMLSQNSLL